LFLPAAHSEIDCIRGWKSLDKELQQIAPGAEIGSRYVDKLVKVWLQNGTRQWMLALSEQAFFLLLWSFRGISLPSCEWLSRWGRFFGLESHFVSSHSRLHLAIEGETEQSSTALPCVCQTLPTVSIVRTVAWLRKCVRSVVFAALDRRRALRSTRPQSLYSMPPYVIGAPRVFGRGGKSVSPVRAILKTADGL
jgi:hypothetical protein